MTNLPPSIREKAWLELRRLLNSCAVNPNGIPMLMVEWLWQHLSESAPEFDEKSARTYAEDLCTDDTGAVSVWQVESCVDGAAWQYDMCKQRVAFFEEALAHADSMRKLIEANRDQLRMDKVQLESKLAAAEAKIHGLALDASRGPEWGNDE